VSSTNKTDRHDITEILLKGPLSTIKQTNKQTVMSQTRRKFIPFLFSHYLNDLEQFVQDRNSKGLDAIA
jgi:hypothetical protein